MKEERTVDKKQIIMKRIIPVLKMQWLFSNRPEKPLKLLFFWLLVGTLLVLADNRMNQIVHIISPYNYLWQPWIMTLKVIALLCSLTALTFLYLSNDILVKVFAYSVTFISMTISLSYRFINGLSFNFWDMKIMVEEAAYAGNALANYIVPVFFAILLSLVIIATIFIATLKIKARTPSSVLLFYFLTLFLLFNMRDVICANFYQPVPLRVPAIFMDRLAEVLKPDASHPRKDIYFTKKGQAKIDKILLIVDESIRGDLLEINNPQIPSTPFLNKFAKQNKNFINLGVASSGGSYSVLSNAFMFLGKPLNNNEDPFSFRPSVFQYCKNAGVTTIRIDSNMRSATNFVFKQHDLLFTDRYLHVTKAFTKTENKWDLDRKAIPFILKSLENNERVLVYFSKEGAHFPQVTSMPPGYTETRKELSHINNAKMREYLAAVNWCADGFISMLMEKLKDQNVLVIYTSDHGKSILEKRHRWSGVNKEQISVPFLLIPVGEQATNFIKTHRAYLKGLKNKASHFQIFSSILYLMGYERKDIIKHYHPDLFSGDISKPRIFYHGTGWQDFD